jgi:hypothetical membrane protein
MGGHRLNGVQPSTGTEVDAMSIRGIQAYAGMAGPPLFLIIMIAAAVSTPGYSPFGDYISLLGAQGAPYSLLVNAAFVILGVAVLLFSASFLGMKGSRPLTYACSALIALAGLGLFMMAAFPCDPGCNNVSQSGLMHRYATIFTAAASGMAMLALSWKLLAELRMTRLGLYTLATFIASVSFWLFLALMPVAGIIGIQERVPVFLSLLWMMLMAGRVRGLSA